MLFGHGDDIYDFDRITANFSSNVWHGGTDSRLIDFLKEGLNKIENYPSPDAGSLRKSLAKHHELNPENFIICNGVTEAIYMIAQTWKEKRATIFSPTFSEYEDASFLNKMDCLFIDYSEISEDLILTTELAFICNPNNPTGRLLSKDQLKKIIKSNQSTTFIIDEAYMDFVISSQSLVSIVSELENLVILKSLTKTFAVPGIRIGYMVAHNDVISEIMHYKVPWSVNTLAIQAGQFIMEKFDDLKPCIHDLIKDTKWLRFEIDSLNNYRTFDTHTHYFLVETLKGNAASLKQYLADEWGILIRDASNFRGLGVHYFRIAVQERSKNKLLVKALGAWNP